MAELIHPTGTLLSDPAVTGSPIDLFGTHFDHLGVGGWRALGAIAERDAIPVTGRMETSNSSGRRRRFMRVYCWATAQEYQLTISDAAWAAAGTEAARVQLLADNSNWEPVTASYDDSALVTLAGFLLVNKIGLWTAGAVYASQVYLYIDRANPTTVGTGFYQPKNDLANSSTVTLQYYDRMLTGSDVPEVNVLALRQVTDANGAPILDADGLPQYELDPTHLEAWLVTLGYTKGPGSGGGFGAATYYDGTPATGTVRFALASSLPTQTSKYRVVELPGFPTTVTGSTTAQTSPATVTIAGGLLSVGGLNAGTDTVVVFAEDAAGVLQPVAGVRFAAGSGGGSDPLKADLVNGKVPAAQLPSYVDDVLSYATLAGFPGAGETGKIYVAEDTNKTYRWGGLGYVEISPSIALFNSLGQSTAGAADQKTVTDALAAITGAKYWTPGVALKEGDIVFNNDWELFLVKQPIANPQVEPVYPLSGSIRNFYQFAGWSEAALAAITRLTATAAEITAGTDNAKVITPKGLRDAVIWPLADVYKGLWNPVTGNPFLGADVSTPSPAFQRGAYVRASETFGPIQVTVVSHSAGSANITVSGDTTLMYIQMGLEGPGIAATTDANGNFVQSITGTTPGQRTLGMRDPVSASAIPPGTVLTLFPYLLFPLRQFYKGQELALTSTGWEPRYAAPGPDTVTEAQLDAAVRVKLNASDSGGGAADIDYASPITHTGSVVLTGVDLGKHHVFTGTGTAVWNITLPAAAASAGKLLEIRIGNGAEGMWELTTAGGDIDGWPARRMWKREVARLLSDGTNWRKVGGRSIPLSVTLSYPTGVTQTLANQNLTELNFGRVEGVVNGPAEMANTAGKSIRALRAGQYVAALAAYCVGGTGMLPIEVFTAINGGLSVNTPALVGGGPNSLFYASLSVAATPLSLQTDDLVSIITYSDASMGVQNGGAVLPKFSLTEILTW